MDALAPDYSDYMYYKAKEWANVDGDGLRDRSPLVDYQFTEWNDLSWMEEYDWEDYNVHYSSTYKLKEVA